MQIRQSGLWGLLGGGNVVPQCQMVGMSDGGQYNMAPPGPHPVSVDLSMYVFGQPSAASTAAMAALGNQHNAPGALRVVQTPMAQLPVQVTCLGNPLLAYGHVARKR